MSKHLAKTTQGVHPWRATARTVFALVLALAAMAPVIFEAVAQSNPEGATGAAAGALAIAGAITRVMALPAVEAFLARFVPWLAADRGDRDDDDEPASAGPGFVEPDRVNFPLE